MHVDLAPLSSYPEAVPVVAEWHFREWGHTDPAGSLEAWTAGMARQVDADKVPGTLIAVAGPRPSAWCAWSATTWRVMRPLPD